VVVITGKFSLFRKSKRGQETAQSASYLIMMLALFLVVYIILLPKQDKMEMMGEVPVYDGYNQGQGGVPYGPGSIGPGQETRNLFSDVPGFMKPFVQGIIQKNLASVSLYSVANQEFETLAANLHIKSSLVSKDKSQFIFSINDFEELQQVKLLFFVANSDGEMEVKVNGIKIMSGEIDSSMLPVTLPKSILGQVNKITFEVESPGLFQFMSTNGYTLKDVVLVKEYINQNNYELRQFVLTEQELYDLKSMTLVFRPNCMSVTDIGRLGIKINGKIIHDAQVVCDAGVAAIDFSPLDLIAGRNIIEFFVDKGQYTLENVLVEGDYTQADFYKAHFVLSPPDMNAILKGADVVLQARFINDGYRKEGTFYVNGFPVHFDTSSSEFITDLNGIVYEGQNIITIVPDFPFEMITLDIFLA
jgi:hypothetical protein